MSYDNPDRVTYSHLAVALSGGNVTRILRGPKGKRGRIVDLSTSLTTTTGGATTPPIIQVGVSGTLGKYAAWSIGAAGAGVTAPAAANATNVVGAIINNADATPQILPADTDIYLTFVSATGAGAAGVGDFHTTIAWF
jgi:hypothetical protein